MPSGTVTAMAWIGVPLTTPRRTVALFRANDAADRIANSDPSTYNLDCFGLGPRLGLRGQEIPQPLAHRIGGLRRPFAKALAGAHAELAGRDEVLDEPGRLGAAVEIGHQSVLNVEGQIDADQVGLLHRSKHRHPRAETA